MFFKKDVPLAENSPKELSLLQEERSNLLNATDDYFMHEAYKTLRTNLKFALKGNTGRCVVVTSSLPEEGKSSVCANLGLSLADLDASVLIIDGDLRKPVQHKLFGLENQYGLSNLIADFTDFRESCKENVYKNLSIIPSGPIPPNPSELLGSARLREILEKVSEEYDYILIDTPPLNIVTDALVIPEDLADMILVCRVGKTTYDQYEKALSSIRLSGMVLLGTVMNQVETGAGSYGRYYKKYEYK